MTKPLYLAFSLLATTVDMSIILSMRHDHPLLSTYFLIILFILGGWIMYSIVKYLCYED